MRGLKLGSNVAVFILFFGLAFVEAVRHGDWLMSMMYVVLALIFLRVDARREPMTGA